jgi:hypothetical protein
MWWRRLPALLWPAVALDGRLGPIWACGLRSEPGRAWPDPLDLRVAWGARLRTRRATSAAFRRLHSGWPWAMRALSFPWPSSRLSAVCFFRRLRQSSVTAGGVLESLGRCHCQLSGTRSLGRLYTAASPVAAVFFPSI